MGFWNTGFSQSDSTESGSINYSLHSSSPHDPIITLGVQFDFLSSDFSNFEPLIGADNIMGLNSANRNINVELGFISKRYFIGLHVGAMGETEVFNDSINFESYNTQAGISFGREFRIGWNLILRPTIGARWQKYRLINTPYPRNLTVNQYADSRNIDLRFHQLFGVSGVQLSYFDDISYDYSWEVGFFMYYLTKINRALIINTLRNRIENDKSLTIHHFTGGISFRLYLNY